MSARPKERKATVFSIQRYFEEADAANESRDFHHDYINTISGASERVDRCQRGRA